MKKYVNNFTYSFTVDEIEIKLGAETLEYLLCLIRDMVKLNDSMNKDTK